MRRPPFSFATATAAAAAAALELLAPWHQLGRGDLYGISSFLIQLLLFPFYLYLKYATKLRYAVLCCARTSLNLLDPATVHNAALQSTVVLQVASSSSSAAAAAACDRYAVVPLLRQLE